MSALLAPGLSGTAHAQTDNTNTAEALGSGRLAVFGTPAMLALMEQAACNAVCDALAPGTSTVGAAMTIAHASPTPTGMQVRAEATLVSVEGRKLTFQCKAFDAAGEIGSCEQTRYLIDEAKFMEKATGKRGNRHG